MTNLEEYINKNKGIDSIEIKIIRVDSGGVRQYVVEYLTRIKKWYSPWKSTYKFIPLYYRDGNSKGFEWTQRLFATKEEAAGFLKRTLQRRTVEVVYHGNYKVF